MQAIRAADFPLVHLSPSPSTPTPAISAMSTTTSTTTSTTVPVSSQPSAVSAFFSSLWSWASGSSTDTDELTRSRNPRSPPHISTSLAPATGADYHPSAALRRHVKDLPLVRRVLASPSMIRAPFHPLLVDDPSSPTGDDDTDDDAALPVFSSTTNTDIEGTLLRGRLLFRDGGVEYGLGGFSAADQTLIMFISLGSMVCGHQGVVHGGLIGAIFDDTMGYLFHAVSRGRFVGFTAFLHVDYRSKLPAGRTVAVCVRISRVEGRKVYLKAEMRDGEAPYEATTGEPAAGGDFGAWVGGKSMLYAQAESLFIIPKEQWAGLVAANAAPW
ncbi:HotDog domain-containing protein [Entophlyctis helioformis]|nr:HotDog domain-containing protein [Entophlyctis helioformis]